MADLRKLKDKAAEHLARGRFAKAAEALAQLVKAEPKDIALRQKLGDALRKAGDARQALQVYQDVADRYARDGQLLKAVAICKLVLELDPDHAETQERLADLYARKHGVGVRIQGMAPAPAEPADEGEEGDPPVELALPAAGRAAAIELPAEIELPIEAEVPVEAEAPVQAPATASPPFSAATPFETILHAARERAAAEGAELLLADPFHGEDEPLPGAVPPPPAPRAAAPPAPPPAPAVPLPRIPLFSDLPHGAFVALAQRITLHRVPAGTAVLRQGEAGTSFFVVASGSVRVEKGAGGGPATPLATLGEGSFFGEMAILSGEPRAATVVAAEESELLEIRADVLLELAREHPQVVESLGQFYRRRLLANAMATSPVFRPFGREERAEIMGRFRTREASPGTSVITEGEPSDGLYVVLSGELGVWKRRDGDQALAGRLHEGDVFGEMSCLRKGPASATVTAARRCLLLRLPRPAFDELVVTYPQILELVSELADERQQTLEAVAGGRAEIGEEGLLVLV